MQEQQLHAQELARQKNEHELAQLQNEKEVILRMKQQELAKPTQIQELAIHDNAPERANQRAKSSHSAPEPDANEMDIKLYGDGGLVCRVKAWFGVGSSEGEGKGERQRKIHRNWLEPVSWRVIEPNALLHEGEGSRSIQDWVLVVVE